MSSIEEDIYLDYMRKAFTNNLNKYRFFIEKPLKLKMSKDLLEKIIFKTTEEFVLGKRYIKKDFAIDWELIKLLDLTGVSFDNFVACKKDYNGMTGIFFNPQTLYIKNLERTNLKGVTFVGSFKDSYLYRTNFKGSRGAKINPQHLRSKNLDYCDFADVNIIGPFNNCSLNETSFDGAIPGIYYNDDYTSIGFYTPVPIKIVYGGVVKPEEFEYSDENIYDESDIVNIEDFYHLKTNKYDDKWIDIWMNTIFAIAIEEQLNKVVSENNKLIRNRKNSY